jgi:hypothetical protein
VTVPFVFLSINLKSMNKGVFSVMRICLRTREWPACVKFHAADHTQFEFQLFCGLSDGTPSDSIMRTEIVGTLTHVGRHMKLFFAGAAHAVQIRVREQICWTLILIYFSEQCL